MSTLVSVLCLPLPSLNSFDIYAIFLLLVCVCFMIIYKSLDAGRWSLKIYSTMRLVFLILFIGEITKWHPMGNLYLECRESLRSMFFCCSYCYCASCSYCCCASCSYCYCACCSCCCCNLFHFLVSHRVLRLNTGFCP